ncbi:hypermethylated in cancer 2 protein-like [Anabrus simplex]|uniref:hypermethylated in cancer 2 protein-like n=1 Tax=Anabrus simplex TaxID=316456 RepID=UPI0035A296CD
MDLEAKIKEEPDWIEGETTASLENFKHVSEVIALKEEVKSELTEPGSMQENSLEENFEHISEVIALKEEVKSELTESGSIQENSLEPSEYTKEEIFIEEHTDDQLLPYIKEETKSRPEVSCRDHQPPDGGSSSFRCSVCSEVLARKCDLLQHLIRHKEDRPFKCDHCGKVFGSRSSLSKHLRIHPLQVCGFSENSFTKRKMLTGNMRLHKGKGRTLCRLTRARTDTAATCVENP